MFLVSLIVFEKRCGGQNIPSFQLFPNTHLSFNLVECVDDHLKKQGLNEMMNSDLSITNVN